LDVAWSTKSCKLASEKITVWQCINLKPKWPSVRPFDK
jgi:hypothetical protein